MINLFKNIILGLIIVLLAGSTEYLYSFAEPSVKWGEPVNISAINSAEDDFAPSWNMFENLLYFNSNISGYSKYYSSKITDSLRFSIPELVNGDLNQPFNNQSYITFISEDKALVSTYRMGEYRPYMNIFQTNRKKKAWTKPIVADSLVFDDFLSQPTISSDGSFIVFSSSLNSGKKDTDLWIAYLKDNSTWGGLSPINELNTTGNEITPFLATNDTLYFATDGQEGPGGFDIFYSVLRQGVWQKPLPVVELNTKFDESDFTILPSGQAVFASNRQGGKGKLDLYFSAREYPVIKKEEYTPPLETSIATQVSSVRTNTELTYKPMPIVPVYFPDKKSNRLLLPNEFSYSNIELNIDIIEQNTLPLIAKRLREQTQAELKIIPVYVNESNSKDIIASAESVKKFLTNSWWIPEKNITIAPPKHISNTSLLNRSSDCLLFESDSAEIFDPLALGKYQISLDPPIIDVIVNGRPSGLIKNWDCNLFVNNRFIKIISQGQTFPGQFSVDLNPLKNELTDADSVKITFSANDSLNRNSLKTIILNLAHSVNKSKEFLKQDNKIYDEFYVFLVSSDLEESMSVLRSTIERVTESCSYSTRVTFSYFNPSLKKASEELSAIIFKNINQPNLKSEVHQSDFNPLFPFSTETSNNIIYVRIEKPIQN